MRLLVINSVCGIKSTGRIAYSIAQEYETAGYEVKIAYGREEVPEECAKYAVRIGNDWDVRCHGVQSRLFDAHGLGSKAATKKFLKWATQYDPDVLWLHNIHGYYINYELLFEWIKSRPQMEVKWTLHDCWAFTGHCSHFLAANCSKWKTQCNNCPATKEYPTSLVCDHSFMNFIKKRNAFAGIKKLTIITPSEWLKACVGESFLSEYPVEVKRNSIDLSEFKYIKSDFKEKHNICGKKMLLGVASTWTPKKGILDFYKLRELLSDEFAIVLVGLNSKQIKKLPNKIIGIEKTNSKIELAEVYSAADFFLNLSYEENYPTVILEAQACGTPVIAYDSGGTRETINDKGKVIPAGDLLQIKDLINK